MRGVVVDKQAFLHCECLGQDHLQDTAHRRLGLLAGNCLKMRKKRNGYWTNLNKALEAQVDCASLCSSCSSTPI